MGVQTDLATKARDGYQSDMLKISKSADSHNRSMSEAEHNS